MLQGRSRGNSSVSSHSNPLFSSAPGGDLDASVDIQSSSLPTVHEVPGEADAYLEARQGYAATNISTTKHFNTQPNTSILSNFTTNPILDPETQLPHFFFLASHCLHLPPGHLCVPPCTVRMTSKFCLLAQSLQLRPRLLVYRC